MNPATRANPPMLTTDRLRLEPLSPDAAADAYEAFADPRLYRYMDGEPPASAHALRDEFARLCAGSRDPAQRWANWLARTRDGAALVGWQQATIVGPTAWIAWVTFAGHRRSGYAREGAAAVVAWLRTLGVENVVAQSDERNAASCATAASLGFVPDIDPIAETLRGEATVDRIYRLRL
jgi:RimJ/RimL family protein N-acetyltransferase